MFPRNTWQVACTSKEISGKPLGRKICNEAMVLYRGQDGAVVALEDFCPHRGTPLSLNHVRDGILSCGCHGMRMNPDVSCAGMNGQRTASLRSKIKSYPAIDRHGYVWVWPGDASLADGEKIPDLHWARSPDWAFGGGAHSRRIIDRLISLESEHSSENP